MDQVRVAAWASDPIALAGLVDHVQARPEVQVLPGPRRGEAAVLVFAAGRVTPELKAALRAAASETPAAIVGVDVPGDEAPKKFSARTALTGWRASAG